MALEDLPIVGEIGKAKLTKDDYIPFIIYALNQSFEMKYSPKSFMWEKYPDAIPYSGHANCPEEKMSLMINVRDTTGGQKVVALSVAGGGSTWTGNEPDDVGNEPVEIMTNDLRDPGTLQMIGQAAENMFYEMLGAAFVCKIRASAKPLKPADAYAMCKKWCTDNKRRDMIKAKMQEIPMTLEDLLIVDEIEKTTINKEQWGDVFNLQVGKYGTFNITLLDSKDEGAVKLWGGQILYEGGSIILRITHNWREGRWAVHIQVTNWSKLRESVIPGDHVKDEITLGNIVSGLIDDLAFENESATEDEVNEAMGTYMTTSSAYMRCKKWCTDNKCRGMTKAKLQEILGCDPDPMIREYMSKGMIRTIGCKEVQVYIFEEIKGNDRKRAVGE
jgi:hypothetical protein